MELTNEQIRDITQMKAEGHSIDEIMKKYPFIKGRSTICKLYCKLNQKTCQKKEHQKGIKPMKKKRLTRARRKTQRDNEPKKLFGGCIPSRRRYKAKNWFTNKEGL